MRALLFDGKQIRFDADHVEPVLASGEALIRPLLAGVCSTDIEICRGYMGFTGVLGHEFVGVVEQVADDCTDRQKQLVGQRVVGGINCVCGQCDMCISGLSTHCRNRTVLGIAGRDGCFADRFVLPTNNLYAVPDGIDNDVAVFTEPVAAACAARQQLHIEGKPYITVLGDGRLGLLVAQVMAKLNASVRVIGKHPEKLERCAKWGIQHRLLDDIALRQDQDVVVDCTSNSDGLAIAMKMVRPRGKILLKTTVAEPQPVDLSPLVIDEIQVIGSRCGNMADGLAILANGEVDVISLISKRLRLESGVEAVRQAAGGALKVLLEFD